MERMRLYCYYLLPGYRTRGREGLGGVENLDGGDSSAHLPLTTLKLNRKSYDFNLGKFSAESKVATGQARAREGGGRTRRLNTGPGGFSTSEYFLGARRCQ